ncbi:hypothetical protein [Flavobacterium hungaricum]|uniref:Phage major capsid protein n=1 Tax=Flavobacterium hungaricum TaxID=2082725 RepID=A0ABR9TRN1_9FLAO|nr:hypothetical protein [Flavobacterium hungaricum]MBE8727981.1 hypothetical protein [Flavobacterium hungaricum]
MGLVADFTDLATSDIYIQSLKEIVKNDVFQQDTSEFFTIVPGIKGGKQVAAMKNFEYVTVASQGCGGTGISPKFPAFSQKWNPKMAEVKIKYCFTEFEDSFVQWGLNNGYARKDLTGTELAVFIEDLVTKAMKADLLRIVLMGDKDIAAQDILTDEAGKTKFYDIIDKGLLPTLQYLKTLPEFSGSFIPLTKNTGAMTDQLNLDATYALDLYESLLDDVYDFEGDTILTSNRLFKNYQKWVKRANGYGIQSNVDLTQKGITDPMIDGESLTPIVQYDRWRRNDFVTGTTPHIHLPHFALFTKKEHLQVGVDDAASLEDITLEYIGGDDESFYIKANYLVDFKMVNPYAFRAAI